MQSGYKVQATLLCLYVIYPHLREHAAAPANPSYANASGLNASPPGSPELPLSRKREKPDATLPATPTTPTHTQQPNGEKPRKTKRAKEDAGGSANREFITVSYRRKKAEPGANGTPNKKVMDSDGTLLPFLFLLFSLTLLISAQISKIHIRVTETRHLRIARCET